MFGAKDFSKTQIGLSKAVYYERDGRGRDSYISTNNGGLGRSTQGNIYEIGTFKSKHTQSMYCPRIQGKNVRYTNNGLGRDSYIFANDGGLAGSGQVRDIYTNGFLDTLRQPREPVSTFNRTRSKCRTIREKNDCYMGTQTFTNWKQKRASSAYRSYQKNRDNTLSRPRVKPKYSQVKLKKSFKVGCKKSKF